MLKPFCMPKWYNSRNECNIIFTSNCALILVLITWLFAAVYALLTTLLAVSMAPVRYSRLLFCTKHTFTFTASIINVLVVMIWMTPIPVCPASANYLLYPSRSIPHPCGNCTTPFPAPALPSRRTYPATNRTNNDTIKLAKTTLFLSENFHAMTHIPV